MGIEANAPVSKARFGAPLEAEHSGNWVGYAAETTKECDFTSITGQWIQPAVTCPRTDRGTLEADFWVGLDGRAAGADPTSNVTLEQTGVEAQCIWYKGKYVTRYRAWYEMLPGPPVYDGGKTNKLFQNLAPLPGSLVTAIIFFNKNEKDSSTLTLTVSKDGKLHQASIAQPCWSGYICKNMSAEWVAEKVGRYGLAPFSQWHLKNGYAITASGKKHAVASLKPVQIDLEVDDHIVAYACNLRSASFTVKRTHC